MSANTIVRGKTTAASTRGSFAPHTRSEPEVTLGVQFGSYDSLNDKIAAMQEELRRATAELASDEGWKRFLDTASKFHRYSLNNQLLIQLQRPGATRCAGYKTWESLGRHVRKGEKGIAILAPRLVNVTDDNGNLVLDDNGKPRKRIAGFTSTTVFDISQTEGEELARLSEPTEEPPAGFIDDLENAIVSQGYTVEYEPLSGGTLGKTIPGANKVVIDSSLSPAQRATTLAHELGHIMCGHMENMSDYHTGHGGRRGDMEMEAESFAYVVARANGMTTHLRAASEYVDVWGKRALEDLEATAEIVSKSTARALRENNWQNLAE